LIAHEFPDQQSTEQWLTHKGVRFVRFDDWKRIDDQERSHGSLKGKPREKITTVKEMLAAIDKEG